MRGLNRFLLAVWAELKMIYADLSRRKIMLVMFAAYPYLLLVFILVIGYSLGNRQVFIERIGVAPEVFFIVSGYLMMAVMGVSDDLLWRPIFDEWMGTLPYVIISATPRLYRYLAIPIPRLLIALFTGFTSVLPITIYFYGAWIGFWEGLVIIFMGLFAAILFVPFVMIIMGLVYSRGTEQWRFINVIRPLILILLGVYYPRYLMPLAGFLASAVIPSSHIIELTQRMLTGSLTSFYAILLVSVATALFIVYSPIGVQAIGVWEKSKLKQGVKLE
jgi:ABC-2 type transport system permease protein